METTDEAVKDDWGDTEEEIEGVAVVHVQPRNKSDFNKAIRYSTWRLIDCCPECGGKDLIKHHDGSKDTLFVTCNSNINLANKTTKRKKTSAKTKQDFCEIDPDSLCGYVFSL